MKNKSRVDKLSKELKALKLEEARLKTERQAIQDEIQSLNSSIEADTKKTPAKKSPTTKVATKKRPIPKKKVFKDRDGTVLNIGDKVIFLTPTKFKSTEGHISQFNPQRVTVLDSRKVNIVKAPHNLRVINKK